MCVCVVTSQVKKKRETQAYIPLHSEPFLPTGELIKPLHTAHQVGVLKWTSEHECAPDARIDKTAHKNKNTT